MSTELVAGTIERAKAQMLANRQTAGERLRELLRRNAKPQAGDDGKLVELVAELNIGLDELPAVLELAQKLDRYEELLPEESPAELARCNAVQAIDKIDAEAVEAHEQIDRDAKARKVPFQKELGMAHQKLRECGEARRWIANARANWSLIVDGKGTAAEWLPTGQ